MKTWEIQNNFQFSTSNFQSEKLVKILLENRKIKTKKEIEEFLNPNLKSLTAENLGLNKKDLSKTLERIKKAIENKEKIIIFGDYDVDGITGTAILWETLNEAGANVMPYIPHRVDEGYGLTKKGIDNVLFKYPDTKLIITVDNGIVANEPVEYANSLGLETIITDHHQLAKKNPEAYSIIHSTLICGAGVAWFLSQRIKNKESGIKNDEHLGLVALATVTDVMQLTGFNRIFVKLGLEELRKSNRPGLNELFKLAGIEQEKIGVYELGFIIGPRINAAGRIEHAMDSLRFLCTKNPVRAKELAEKLHLTNAKRQQMTFDSVSHAKSLMKEEMKKLIFVSDKSYDAGVIGLISGRITEEYYRPSIAVSIGQEFSKGSARSVRGFNIIEFIRKFSDLLLDHGGHPMAAGFTVETKDLSKLQKLMAERAEKEIDEKLLVRKLKIDCELPIEFISLELFEAISKLSPFGYGNSEPSFLAKDLIIQNMRLVGAENKHLKLELGTANYKLRMPGIMFAYDKNSNLKIGNQVDVVYNISQNEWNGNKNLELKIKDLKNNY